MRFSTLTTVALYGLGSLLHTANGAPTSLASRSDALQDFSRRAGIPVPKVGPKPKPAAPHAPPPAPPPPPRPLPGPAGSGPKPVTPAAPPTKQYPPKPVPDAFNPASFPYTREARPQPDPNWGTVYDVKTPHYKNGESPVNVIAINRDKNSIGVMEAWNKEDKPPGSPKLSLADIEMKLFTESGKHPQDLQLIHVDNVVNKEAKSAIVNVYTSMKESTLTGNTITLRASGSGAERDGYNSLSNTVFGAGADKLRQQFSVGKPITQYTVYGHKDSSGQLDHGKFDSRGPVLYQDHTNAFLVDIHFG